MSDGYYLDGGVYRDFETNEVVETLTLEHSIFGIIKYVFFNDVNHVVQHDSSQDITGWEDEL